MDITPLLSVCTCQLLMARERERDLVKHNASYISLTRNLRLKYIFGTCAGVFSLDIEIMMPFAMFQSVNQTRMEGIIIIFN